MLYLNKEKVIKFTLLLSIITLCDAIMAVILYGVNQFKMGSQLASINQVSYLSHTLVRQQANLMSVLLLNNADQETLSENLDRFCQQEFVLDATVYSPRGVILAQSNNDFNFRLRIGLNSQAITSQPITKQLIAKQQMTTQQIVEPIYSTTGLIGFLRVTFDTQYGQTTQDKIDALFHHLYGELIIVFFSGAVFASSIHYFLRKRRKIILTDKINKSAVNKPLAKAAQQFHSKRRRFRR